MQITIDQKHYDKLRLNIEKQLDKKGFIPYSETNSKVIISMLKKTFKKDFINSLDKTDIQRYIEIVKNYLDNNYSHIKDHKNKEIKFIRKLTDEKRLKIAQEIYNRYFIITI